MEFPLPPLASNMEAMEEAPKNIASKKCKVVANVNLVLYLALLKLLISEL